MAQTANAFLSHAKNRQFVKSRTGKPKLRANILGSMTIFFVGTLLTSGLIIFMFSLILPHYATLARSRAPVEAVITDKRIEKDADLANEYWFDYEYTIGDVVYEGQDMLGRAEYNTYTIGMPIEVVYSPEQPSLSMIEYEPIVVLAMTGIALLFFAIGLGGSMLGILSWWDRQQLIRKGKIIGGTIEEARQSTDPEDGQIKLVINYTFRSPLSGKQLHKRETFYDPQTYGKAQSGAKAAVLYLRDNLYHLL